MVRSGWAPLALVLLASCTPPTEPGDSAFPWADSPVSGLPQAPASGIPQPSGSGTGLEVLDWAGFSGAASFSFDDTQPSQVAHWADLKATGVRLTFYVWADQAANSPAVWKEAAALGHELGNHTATHKTVADLAAPQASTAAAELDSTSALITGTFGQAGVWTMAYPYGDTAWKPYLGQRFLAARTVNGGLVSARAAQDLLALPTYLASKDDTAATLKAAYGRAVAAHSWVIYTIHSLLPTTQNWYAGLPVTDVTAAIAGARDSGQVWVDSVVNVAAYRVGAALVRGAAPVAEGQTLVRTWTLPAGFPPGKWVRVVPEGGTLSQGGRALGWDGRGYYEVSLDEGNLTWEPAGSAPNSVSIVMAR